jgi:hypothetical protein
MEYTTYEFYTDEYYGDSVPESSFPKWQSKAAAKLNYICFGHITGEDLEKYGTQIQMATCALVDVLYKLEVTAAEINDPQKGNIKSINSGVQSISFGSTETEYTLAVSDSGRQMKLMTNAVSEYLSGTGLMYAGLD